LGVSGTLCRGPEVEHWIGIENEDDISDWPLLPFLALADGAHSSSEDFSYFTLKHDNGRYKDVPTSLFGIACTRQLDSKQLIDRPASVTRSTVQKAVVVIADSPTVFFGHLKQQLSAVTHAWFAQRYVAGFLWARNLQRWTNCLFGLAPLFLIGILRI
jgi:hypothetical protein